ncbi:AraC family transcriptional regulator [Flavobacterium sp. JAS]|uniref:helix-turn-helix domain-containing protein n=1 Tax=Flavobacterium sp. JAS TaxID=2897329 RepID=UPI001E285FCC|nr:AraC family transcriptional regulator [Flavobacterium sp. JAS]MCD0470351.1 AraC family transcriptional regulator [Flavobacterium sp. JAS]
MFTILSQTIMMESVLVPNDKVSNYVKNIFLLENDCADDKEVSLPFFADGYPGIMFHISKEGVFLQPANKKLASIFLYGQTIHPIELSIKGSYRLIIFQLFPFAAKMLLGVDPKELNDDCFDLNLLDQDIKLLLEQLNTAKKADKQIEIISSFIERLIDLSNDNIDSTIQSAINIIISHKGKITIKDLREKLHITERTFERLFVNQVGVNPQQFTKIIQFQNSLEQLSREDYSLLTDIVFENGFTDQSHFIRTFKKYTGKTPTEFQKTP